MVRAEEKRERRIIRPEIPVQGAMVFSITGHMGELSLCRAYPRAVGEDETEGMRWRE